MSTLALENAVLSTFVVGTSVTGIYSNKDLFHLDPTVFTSSLRRRVAEVANDAIEKDTPLSEVFYSAEEKLKYGGVQYQDDWLDILATKPLPVSDAKYYNGKLKEAAIRRRMSHEFA